MINAFELELLNGLQTFWADVQTKIGTNQDILNDVFENLPATGDYGANRKAIGESFKKMYTGSTQDDLRFILQFPYDKVHIPCISIEVGTEQEEEVIGAFVQQDYNQGTGLWEVKRGGAFQKTYSIGCYSFNADTTLYLYSLVKYGLLILRNSLQDIATIHVSGRPAQIDFERFSPDVVFFRYIDLSSDGIIDSVVERSPKVIATDVDVHT